MIKKNFGYDEDGDSLDFKEKVATLIVEFRNKIKTEVFDLLSDEELAQVPEILEECHKNSYGFRTTEYDEIADDAIAHLNWRKFFNKVDELGKDPKTKKEIYFMKDYVPERKYHSKHYLDLNCLSRENLIEIILDLKQLPKYDETNVEQPFVTMTDADLK